MYNGLQNCLNHHHTVHQNPVILYLSCVRARRREFNGHFATRSYIGIYIPGSQLISAQLIKMNLKIYFRALCHVFIICDCTDIGLYAYRVMWLLIIIIIIIYCD